MLRSAALHAATAVLQGTANVGLPVTAATSLLSALAAVSESNQNDVARGVIAASDSHADAIVAAVGQVADQLAARVEIGGDVLVVSSTSVQVHDVNSSAAGTMRHPCVSVSSILCFRMCYRSQRFAQLGSCWTKRC
jgi:hypothetical protein